MNTLNLIRIKNQHGNIIINANLIECIVPHVENANWCTIIMKTDPCCKWEITIEDSIDVVYQKLLANIYA